MKSLLIVLALLIAGFSQTVWAGGKQAQAKKEQAAIVAAEITAFANHLALRPHTAIDFSKVSGEYCFDLGLGQGGHMTHYAIDPTKTDEDVIDFVAAQPLLDAGAKFDGLPQFPGTLGSMQPNQWYFILAGAFEPHHGKKFPMPMLMRASTVK